MRYTYGARVFVYWRCPWLSFGIHIDGMTPYVCVYLPWFTVQIGRVIWDTRRIQFMFVDVAWETDYLRFERDAALADVPDDRARRRDEAYRANAGCARGARGGLFGL